MDTEKRSSETGIPRRKSRSSSTSFPLPAFLMREKSKRWGYERLQKCVLVRAPEKRQQLKKSEGQS
jgi:hypothetical protein